MNFLKKLNCAFLVVCFLACLCVPVAAEELDLSNASSSVNVKAKYVSGVVTDTYSVDIEWGSMEFEYVDAGTKWNPETHEYETTDNPYWRCADGANEVTVTNHSNKPVQVNLEYTPKTDFSDITGAFDITEEILDAAEANGDVETAPSFTSKLTLSGALSSSLSSSTTIGTAKVTISAPEMVTSNGSGAGSETESSPSNGAEAEEDIPTDPVGYVYLYSKIISDNYEYTSSIYQQSSNVFIAEICAETVMETNVNPDTHIYINDTLYYIYEEGEAYEFNPGTTVNINKEFYDDGESTARRKQTVIEAGKTYRLTITLDEASGTGTATLEEISA